MDILQLLRQGDAITQSVAVLLLAMSVASWVVILWKAWLVRRAEADVAASTAAFWQAADIAQARERLQAVDREALVLPLVEATQPAAPGLLASAGHREQQLTRTLRDALHRIIDKLQFGQVLLATVGSTAPFVGLLGTVWGIYHALTGIAGSGTVSTSLTSAWITSKVCRPTAWVCWPSQMVRGTSIETMRPARSDWRMSSPRSGSAP